MNEKLNLLLIEDDPSIINEFKLEIEKFENFNFFTPTGSEIEALEIINENDIDILIIDLELEEGDGIHLMHKLHEMDTNQFQFICIVTNVRSEIVHQSLRELGADIIYTKNNPQYSANAILDMIRIAVRYTRNVSLGIKRSKVSKKILKAKIYEYLNQRLAFPETKGTTYIVDAITHLVFEDYYTSMTEVYKIVSEENKVSSASVEKGIRDAITDIWDSNPESVLDIFYPYSQSCKTGRPKNKDFLLNVAKGYTKLWL